MECLWRYGLNSRVHLLQEDMCNSALPRITACENSLAEAEFHDLPLVPEPLGGSAVVADDGDMVLVSPLKTRWKPLVDQVILSTSGEK